MHFAGPSPPMPTIISAPDAHPERKSKLCGFGFAFRRPKPTHTCNMHAARMHTRTHARTHAACKHASMHAYHIYLYIEKKKKMNNEKKKKKKKEEYIERVRHLLLHVELVRHPKQS